MIVGLRTLRSRRLTSAIPALVLLFAGASWAQESVSVVSPAFITLNVSDISQTSSASPSSVTVSFSSASLNPGMSLSISVMADASSFTPPSGSSIPASKVSWTTAGASGGSGYSGALSSASYTEVFRSSSDPSSGSVDITFTLDSVSPGLYAGDHDLNLIWKFESVL